MNTPNPHHESLAALEALLLTPPQSLDDMENTNAHLTDLFGNVKVAAAAPPKYEIEMPFVDRHSAYHQLVPLVDHKAHIRPETNAQVQSDIRIHSPFQPNARRFPLVGVSFTSHQWDAPLVGIHRNKLYAHFEVLPVQDAKTIVTITALQEDWIKHGRSLIKFTSR